MNRILKKHFFFISVVDHTMFPQSSRSYDDGGRNWGYGPIHEEVQTSERQLGPHPFLTFRPWASGILTNKFLLGPLCAAAGHSRALANAVANYKQSLTLMISIHTWSDGVS